MILKQPKKNTFFYEHADHLALFYKSETGTDYWKKYWSEPFRSNLVAQGKSGYLGEFKSVIEKYIKKDQLILEAGCGPAHFAAALAAQGYKVIGVDSEPEAVRFAKENLPRLDIRVGDVENLDMASGSVGCYLSLGVVEHFMDGPDKALKEARRLIHPEGVALISVPYLNPLRKRLKDSLTKSEKTTELFFHQYYYGVEGFSEYLEQAGFSVIDLWPYAVHAFLTREHIVYSSFWNSFACREKIKKVLRKAHDHVPGFIRKQYGHMLMFVCRPK